MLFQPSNITPDEVYGTGTVDLSQPYMNVSWRVSGDSPMVAYRISIYENTPESTGLITTTKTVLDEPFWGVNYAGETQLFTAAIPTTNFATNGITNGHDYKFYITQWWGNTNEESIRQATASVFRGRATPTLTIDTIPDPLTSYAYSFTATYAQAQGDGIRWVRWQIADADSEDAPFVDTGPIYGTGELRVDYDGFITDNTYAVKCTIETLNGIQVTTDWYEFLVDYSVSVSPGSVEACQVANDCYVWVQWDSVQVADGYSVFRRRDGDDRLVKIADVPATAGQIRDYSAQSGNTYTYYVFPTGSLAYLTDPMVSDPVKVQYWLWGIIEAEQIAKNEYSVLSTYLFKYGAGGVGEGQFSNNNNPSVNLNFTRYPTRQGSSANYLTGSVGGYIGTVTQNTREYYDSVTLEEALRKLSVTKNALFLADPKGHFLRIHTSAPISFSVNHKSVQMPITLTVSWTEIGTTEGVHVIAYPGGDFYPTDRIIFTTVRIDTATGALIWETPDNYSGSGSTLNLSEGQLYQNDGGSFIPATMAIDADTKILSATLADEGGGGE